MIRPSLKQQTGGVVVEAEVRVGSRIQGGSWNFAGRRESKGEPAGFLRSLQFVLTQFVLSDQGIWKSQRELLRTPSRIRVDSRRRRRRRKKKE